MVLVRLGSPSRWRTLVPEFVRRRHFFSKPDGYVQPKVHRHERTRQHMPSHLEFAHPPQRLRQRLNGDNLRDKRCTIIAK